MSALQQLQGQWAGYAPEKELPLGGYLTLMSGYAALAGGWLAMSRSVRRRSPGMLDLLLLGPATHKAARIMARDWVTSPLRAPFVEYRGPAPGGEVDEKAKGTGLQRAVGDLVTCPFCMGPWVALGLGALVAAAPKPGRWMLAILSAVTVSDFLHRAYARLAR